MSKETEPPICPRCYNYMRIYGDKFEWLVECPECGYTEDG